MGGGVSESLGIHVDKDAACGGGGRVFLVASAAQACACDCGVQPSGSTPGQ